MISEDTIQKLKQINPIEIIGQYVKLKRSGSEYVGLCPFHNEHTPSFFVHPKKGYHCFGCDAKGSNAIDFIMAYEEKEFRDAVIQVAGMADIYIDSDNAVPAIPLKKIKPVQPAEPKLPDYIPEELISKNLAACKRNNLYPFLTGLFGEDKAWRLFSKYGVGASNYYGEGTTLFVQRDMNGNIGQAKVILYDPITGKRCREQGKEPRIIGRQIIGNTDANLTQCLFGEHILVLQENEGRLVAVVESEKTAVICSGGYPDFLWLATGGKNGCNIANPQVNHVLRGRELHLFPDVDGVQDWHKVASELRQQGFDVFVNDIMTKYAEPGSKEDIADLIVQSRKQKPSSPLVPAKPSSPAYPPQWDNPEPLHDPITEKYRKQNAMQNLIGQGNRDAGAYQSGQITAGEWQVRSRVLEARILAAGITLADYASQVKRLSVKNQ